LAGDVSDLFKRRSDGSKPRRELVEVTEHVSPDFPDFQLVHITSAGKASEILNLEPPWLKAMPCKVFDGQERLYFFVMRPLFRLGKGDVSQTLVSHFPVAFVMEAKELGAPIHAAPFDTGAAHTSRFDDYHSPGACLDDYLLEPDLEAIKKFLSWGYGSPEAYFNGELKKYLVDKIPNFMSVAHSWLHIAQAAAPAGPKDLRGAAVEIAYDRGFQLEAYIKFCVFPDEFLQDRVMKHRNNTVMGFLEEKSIKYETYAWRRGAQPNYFLSEINHKIKQYYKSVGVMR
jgi:hypothetical protein